MSVIYLISIGLLLTAALLALWRIFVGPSGLDRILGADVTVVILISGFAVVIVHTDAAPALPILVVLSMIGFVGAVSVARFIERRRRSRR